MQCLLYLKVSGGLVFLAETVAEPLLAALAVQGSTVVVVALAVQGGYTVVVVLAAQGGSTVVVVALAVQGGNQQRNALGDLRTSTKALPEDPLAAA